MREEKILLYLDSHGSFGILNLPRTRGTKGSFWRQSMLSTGAADVATDEPELGESSVFSVSAFIRGRLVPQF